MPARTPLDGTPCWIDLTSSDTAAATTFYSEVFGWKADQNEDPQYGGYGIFSKDGQPIAGIGPQQEGNPFGNFWTTYLSATDAGATADKAVAAGGAIMMPAMQVGSQGSMAIVSDPAGAVVGIWQADEHAGFGLVAEAGAPVWHESLSKNYSAALPFYSDVFGWQYETLGDSDEFRYSQANFGGAPIAGIMDASSFLPAEAPSFWRVYLGTDNTDDTVARVLKFGGSVIEPAQDTPFGRIAAVADPLGATFQVSTVVDITGA